MRACRAQVVHQLDTRELPKMENMEKFQLALPMIVSFASMTLNMLSIPLMYSRESAPCYAPHALQRHLLHRLGTCPGRRSLAQQPLPVSLSAPQCSRAPKPYPMWSLLRSSCPSPSLN